MLNVCSYVPIVYGFLPEINVFVVWLIYQKCRRNAGVVPYI